MGNKTLQDNLSNNNNHFDNSAQTESDNFNKRKFKYVRKKFEDQALSIKTLENGVNSFIIATKQHPATITKVLFKYLLPGHPFVIFTPYREMLIDLYDDYNHLVVQTCTYVKLG